MSDERLIETLAYNLFTATLVGNPAPAVKELYDRMKHPEPGDLVLEVTTLGAASRDGARLGRLVRVAQEPIDAGDEWPADEPIPTERVWYIELPDGREFRWLNASFIAVPTEITGWQRPFVSDPSGRAAPASVATPRNLLDSPDVRERYDEAVKAGEPARQQGIRDALRSEGLAVATPPSEPTREPADYRPVCRPVPPAPSQGAPAGETEPPDTPEEWLAMADILWPDSRLHTRPMTMTHMLGHGAKYQVRSLLARLRAVEQERDELTWYAGELEGIAGHDELNALCARRAARRPPTGEAEDQQEQKQDLDKTANDQPQAPHTRGKVR